MYSSTTKKIVLSCIISYDASLSSLFTSACCILYPLSSLIDTPIICNRLHHLLCRFQLHCTIGVLGFQRELLKNSLHDSTHITTCALAPFHSTTRSHIYCKFHFVIHYITLLQSNFPKESIQNFPPYLALLLVGSHPFSIWHKPPQCQYRSPSNMLCSVTSSSELMYNVTC